jgi:hypothetical protein
MSIMIYALEDGSIVEDGDGKSIEPAANIILVNRDVF